VHAGRALRRKILGDGDRFDCAVRVVSGTVPGERSRSKHRASQLAGNVLTRGDIALPVELLDQVPTHPRLRTLERMRATTGPGHRRALTTVRSLGSAGWVRAEAVAMRGADLVECSRI
jgi:hypothetical protein